MKESATCQAVLEEGRNEGLWEGRLIEARETLLRLGARRFGTPDAPAEKAIRSIASLERLEALLLRVPGTENWGELLALS